MKQPEALRLADEHDENGWIAGTRQWCAETSAELRRLHEVNQMLVEALEMILASTHPYREDGSPTIPNETVNQANAAIAKAGEV